MTARLEMDTRYPCGSEHFITSSHAERSGWEIAKNDLIAAEIEESEAIFQDPDFPELMIRAARPADNAVLLRLMRVTMPSNGLQLSFEREPDYLKSTAALYDLPQALVVVEKSSPDRVLGLYNIGQRWCYVNGIRQLQRYVGDLRVVPEAQGKGVVRLYMRQLRQLMPAPHYCQAVILADNAPARAMLTQKRAGFPNYFEECAVITKLITGDHMRRVQPAVADPAQTRWRTATAADAAALTAFVQKMASYYTNLPAYDFKALRDHPNSGYWLGLRLSDFRVQVRVRTHVHDLLDGFITPVATLKGELETVDCEEIVALYGLWNQKSFKQTRMRRYHPLLKLARPAYNWWAKRAQRIELPEEGGVLDYRMVHSPLCLPEVAVMEDLLSDALQQARAQGIRAICLSLGKTDPRRPAYERFIGEETIGVSAYYSFGEHRPEALDAKGYIPYFEAGRL